MSTTFEVYPATHTVPSFVDVLGIANDRLHGFLAEVDLPCQPRLTVQIRQNQGDKLLPLDSGAPARWRDDQYAWFTIPGVPGGTDAYFRPIWPVDRELWDDEIRSDRYRGWESSIRAFLNVGHFWVFRRSAGQPGLINLSYGLLAGAVAQCTEGFVDTTDAWGYARLPASGKDFAAWYFLPQYASRPDDREWAEKNIAAMAVELREAGYRS